MGLTTLSPSYVDCLEVLGAFLGLHRGSFTFTLFRVLSAEQRFIPANCCSQKINDIKTVSIQKCIGTGH